MFDKKVKGQNLFKSNIIYTIGKFFKSTYLKWSCILDLRLWIKSYDKKKNQGSNVQVPFSPREKRLKLPSPPRRKGVSCHGEQFFIRNKFLIVWQKNTLGKLLSKLNVFYTIKKFFKLKYLKWSCILDLKLWTKSYGKNKSQGSLEGLLLVRERTYKFEP
jgi:hypothetical protein